MYSNPPRVEKICPLIFSILFRIFSIVHLTVYDKLAIKKGFYPLCMMLNWLFIRLQTWHFKKTSFNSKNFKMIFHNGPICSKNMSYWLNTY